MPFSAGLQDVKVTLKNFGYQTLTTANIRWSVNGVLQTPFFWSGSIPFGSSEMDVNIGSYDFQPGAVNQMKIWSDLPNGNPDLNKFNDSTIQSLFPALCGTYTIGGDNPDFMTFNSAVDYMHNAGITCPVLFNVRDGQYDEKIIINQILGSSQINTVTFQSQSSDSSLVTILWTVNGSWPIININGSQNMIFRKIGIKWVYPVGYYPTLVTINSPSKNISFENCFIRGADGINISNASDIKILNNNFNVSSGITLSNTANVVINKNKFINTGFNVITSSGTNTNHIEIIKNEFINSGIQCINISYGLNDTINISDNLIENTSSGISVSGTGLCNISGNRILNFTNRGIGLSGNSASSKFLVFNNYISSTNQNLDVVGIDVAVVSNASIIFNNLNIQAEGKESKAILIGESNGLLVKNNIIVNVGMGYCAFLSGQNTSFVFDYNDYFSGINQIGHISDTLYSTLSSWASAIEGESNGKNVIPCYTTSTNLAPNHILLNNVGTPITGIDFDIDSTLRNQSFPDIGAKEFSPCNLDAGIDRITSPITPFNPGLNEVKVILQNQGLETLSSVTINWKVNGIIQTPMLWNGTLNSGQNTELAIGYYEFLSATAYKIDAWTSLPNNGLDCNFFNDSSFSRKIYPILCGNYTIGGSSPDFETFNLAIDFLHNVGISCPVIFNVRDGLYDEKILLNQINGTSTVNTVTFKSQSNDSSLVTILWTVNGSWPTINLNGAQNIIFKKIGIKWVYPVGYYPTLVTINSPSNNISFENCLLQGALCMSMSNSSNVKIKSNNFTGSGGVSMSNTANVIISANKFTNIGFDGVTSSGSNVKHLEIAKNRFVNISGQCINVSYGINDTLNLSNNYFENTPVCIIASGAGQCTISGNRLFNFTIKGIEITGSAKSSLFSIFNNFISSTNKNLNSIGILVNAVSNANILYNNINIRAEGKQSKSLQIFNSSNLGIKNNIFANVGRGYCVYITGEHSSVVFDYNDYYSSYNRIGRIGKKSYLNLSSWALVIQGEMHGISAIPFFTSATNLVPHQILLNNTGIPTQGIDYDIDSILRNTLTPDLGAKEFSPCLLDAGVNHITIPVTPVIPSSQEVKAVLQNQGTISLTRATIHWEVNGEEQGSIQWTGNLESVQNEVITLGTYPFQTGTVFRIKVWTTNPNNGTDCDPYNDTIVTKNFPKLCGVYTIGGSNPDFQSFYDAESAVSFAGISCPVNFKTRDGIYQERIEIDTIPGSSPINTVTFDSESGDSSMVILETTGMQTVILEGAQNINFQNISILGNDLSGILIYPPSENIKISNCVINTKGSWMSGLEFSYHGTSRKIIVSNNAFYQGTYGISLDCAREIEIHNNSFKNLRSAIYFNANGYTKHVKIDSNIVSDCGEGISYYPYALAADSIIITNNHLEGCGMEAKSISHCVVNGNKIQTSSSSGIYLNSNNAMVFNNFITISGNNVSNGINITNTNSSNIVFNSINMLNTNTNSKAFLYNSGENLVIKNNIFSNKSGGFCAYLNTTSATILFDYNDYYSTQSRIGYINGTIYPNFSSWASAIGGEASGRNLDPYFANDSSYKVYQRGLNGAGIPVPGVLFDIEDKIRNDQAPDIGAWEFMVDFGITQVLHPTLTCSQNPNDSLTILIRQFGDVPFTDIRLAYKINNEPVVYDTIIGTIYNDIIYTFKQRINITSQGNYTIKCWLVENIDDNIHNDTITVQRYSYPAPVIDFSYQSSCENLGIKLTGTATVLPPYSIASYEWYFGDGDTSFVQNPTHLYPQAGVFAVTFRAYNNMGCYNETTKTITVEEYNPLQLQLTSKDETCNNSCNGEVDIVVTGGEAPIQRYFNNELITQDKVSNLCTDTYPVRIVDNKGCEILTNVVIKTESPMTIGIAADPMQGYAPLDVNLSAPGTGAASWEWYNKGSVISRDSVTNITIAEQGTHTFILRTSSGPPNNCTLVDSVKIQVVIFVEIIIPNAFTPNDDGYNDTFGPVTKGIGSLEMNISDRNGRFVHKIDSVNGRWDGNMPSGTKAPRGVYYYLLTAMGYDNQEYVRQGNVNLYRDLVDITPNPVKTKAVLDLSGTLEGSKTIAIYAASGLPVKVWTTPDDVLQLDLSFLEAGFYILKASDSEQVILVKFIKE